MTATPGERIAPRPPPLFDGALAMALAVPALAALAFAGALAREAAGDGPTDPAALLLRVIAYAFALAAIHHLGVIARRLVLMGSYRRHGLALEENALVFTSPRSVVRVAKDDVLAAREPGDWGGRTGARRFSEVHVILHPRTGKTHLTLPPVFELSPGELAEAIMRWRGPLEVREGPLETPKQLGSKVYDEAARTGAVPGGIVIRHGRGWLARGPYASVLLGIAIVEGVLRSSPTTRALLGPEMVAVVASVLFLVPLGWIVLSLREVRPRKGLALVLTPTEVLIRARGGVVRTPLESLAKATVDEQRAWSVVLGIHRQRTLVIDRKDAPAIRYDEAFLGAPADVVAALLEAGKRGQLA